jgi:hypothetical protein
MSNAARDVLTDGLSRSVTIRRLVQSLQVYRVFVLIDTRVDPAVPTGQTSLLAATTAGRYMHVVLNPAMPHDRRLELLAHELQHCLEIASSDDVLDGASLRRHFMDIGRLLGSSAAREKAFETDAARDVEIQVRRDLSVRHQTAS